MDSNATPEPTVKVVNTSKCRRELTIDVQDYRTDLGPGPGRDRYGKPLQPITVSKWLEQGANEVPESFVVKCREHSTYIDTLFTKRILRIEPIKPAVVDERVGLAVHAIEDLSQLKESYARKLIKECKDVATLRTWVDQEYRPAIREALRKRWAELVPAETFGVDEATAV